LTNVFAIYAGGGNNIAILQNRKVVVWGGSEIGTLTPPTWATNISTVAPGQSHVTAVIGDIPLQAPCFITQPVSRTNRWGENVVFEAIVFPQDKVSFQWYKNDNPIPLATNMLLFLNNISRKDEGAYYLVASNNAGSIKSSNAMLHVIVPQTIQIQQANTSDAIRISFSDFDGQFMKPENLQFFEIQTSTNLMNWERANYEIFEEDGRLYFMETNRLTMPQKFYRIISR
jgi:hypothetical protein